MNGYSRADLLDFLDYLGTKGLANKNTIISRKVAVGNVLGVLSDEEAEDLNSINIDDVFYRFQNLNPGKYTPDSLQVYKSRASRALTDFLRFKENPSGFRPNTPSDRLKPKVGSQTRKPSESRKDPVVPEQPPARPAQNTITIPIALRLDCIIQIQGVPIDMTRLEAQKIANVVLAMATSDAE